MNTQKLQQDVGRFLIHTNMIREDASVDEVRKFVEDLTQTVVDSQRVNVPEIRSVR